MKHNVEKIRKNKDKVFKTEKTSKSSDNADQNNKQTLKSNINKIMTLSTSMFDHFLVTQTHLVNPLKYMSLYIHTLVILQFIKPPIKF